MARLKYMGAADVAKLGKGEDFGGRVSEGLGSEVTFDKSNNWTIDTDEAGLSAEQVAALLDADSDRFKDVTDLKSIPSNLHQRTFLGHGKKVTVTGDTDVEPSGASTTGGGGTTVGGSTGGTTGGGRGRGTTAGGSTS